MRKDLITWAALSLCLTSRKLDGSSKGGITLAINHSLNIPIKLYGYGEKMEDIEVFDIESYLYNLFEGILFEEKEVLNG